VKDGIKGQQPRKLLESAVKVSVKADASETYSVMASYRRSDTIELREVPKALHTKHGPKGLCGQGNDLGYGNSGKDETMGNPQPSPKGK
jgi:hypothetical protein